MHLSINKLKLKKIQGRGLEYTGDTTIQCRTTATSFSFQLHSLQQQHSFPNISIERIFLQKVSPISETHHSCKPFQLMYPITFFPNTTRTFQTLKQPLPFSETTLVLESNFMPFQYHPLSFSNSETQSKNRCQISKQSRNTTTLQ